MQSVEPSSSARRINPIVRAPEPGVLDRVPLGERSALERRLREPTECFYDPSFELPETEALLTGPMPPAPEGQRKRRRMRSDDSGFDLLADAATESFTSAQERHMFLRLNYARFRIMRLLTTHADRPLTHEAITALLRWERVVQDTRNEIVRANVPLVLAMAKRTRINSVDVTDLISEGNLALLRSVDKFDCARGFKFSTYACRSILKAFSRVATRTARHRGYFPTEFDPTLEKSDHQDQCREDLERNCVNELKSVLAGDSTQLNEIERQVILARFAIEPLAAGQTAAGAVTTDGDSGAETGEGADSAAARNLAASASSDSKRCKTLEQVGEMIGVTKERVRQIQNKALNKLKTFLEDALLAG